MEGQSKEYMCERGATSWGGRARPSKEEMLGKGEVETSAVATPLGDAPGGSEPSEL